MASTAVFEVAQWHFSSTLLHQLPPGVGREGKEESKPCTQGGFVPGLPQGRTQQEVHVSRGRRRQRSQAGSGESWEAVGFLPDTTEVTASTGIPLPAHLLLQLIHRGAVVGNTEQCKGLQRITGKLPESQESLRRERKPLRNAWKAAAPAPPAYTHPSLHYLTLLPCLPSTFASVPALLPRLAGSQRPQKGISQLICTGKEMCRTGEGEGHV